MKYCTVSAPGRLDLLNTHQDYKGLPVVPVAINLRIKVKGLLRNDDKFEIFSKGFGKGYFSFPTHYDGSWLDFFKATFNMISETYGINRGFELEITSNIPTGAGLGSSGALLVALVKLLSKLYELDMKDYEIAELAYKIEREKLKIPCGRLDQYSSTFGWVILLKTRAPPQVLKVFRNLDLIFVAIDSGVRRKTLDVHSIRQRELEVALEQLSRIANYDIKDIIEGLKYDEIRWEDLSEEVLQPYLSLIDKTSAMRLLFTIKMNESTERGLKALEKINKRKSTDAIFELASVLNEQHELLRDLYEVSHPRLEILRDIALKAGALGVKISGAGMGGSLLALVDDEKIGENVRRAVIKAGAKDAWIVKIDEGVRIELEEGYL